jgi:hypothetical protein
MHGGGMAYFVLGEDIIREPDYLRPAGGGCPFAAAAAAPAEVNGSSFKFGRLIDKAEIEPEQRQQMVKCLTALGACMNNPGKCGGAAAPSFSEIPSGYTYLGQFIAHEITADMTKGLPPEEMIPANLRSPSLDLDSLYGKGQDDPDSQALYEPGIRGQLRLGPTEATKAGINKSFDNDLPRDEATGKAFLGDPRNDENLAVAQTHVAFIKFPHRVMADLKAGNGKYKDVPRPPADKLFEAAQAEVVKHFQWIVLNDYLEKMVDGVVLAAVRGGDLRLERFKVAGKEELFMPLEFSAAAFRLGHSMVRPNYQWNAIQSNELGFGPATLGQLFAQTQVSNAAGFRRLPSDWIIDWRRFYDFGPLGHPGNLPQLNVAGQIDTVFDLHLEEIQGFDHQGLLGEQQYITVRNLLRGLAFSLPCGQEVARAVGEDALKDELTKGPHAALLDAEPIRGKTPLWFYVLREAKARGTAGKLGPVGSRIVAETLFGLVLNSDQSILREKDWRPAFSHTEGGESKFGMIDLLDAAGVIDPIGDHMNKIYHH